MASWGMARRVADACASSVAGGAAAAAAASSSRGRRVSTAIPYVRFPSSPPFHHLSQRLTLFSSHPSSSSCSSSSSSSTSASPLSTSCASPSETSVGFRRPEEIAWQKDLTNSVSLIGHIHRGVDIRYLDSGKIVASTAIRVKRPALSATEATVFSLQFWDELAEIAAAHLKKEDHVYIAGSVWVENYVDKDNLQRSICKVVARDLKFVGNDYRDGSSRADEQPNQVSSVDDQWKEYFQNPSDYWDNRVGKKNPRGPDFKHKSTGVALWIDNKRNPSWVIDRLEQERLKLEENSEARPREDKLREMEKLWQAFFANPLDWWDNRDSKKNPKYPDFKNKTSGEALWVESYTNPSWVKSQLQAMDSKAKIAKEGGGRVDGSKEKSSKTSFEDEDLGFF